MGCREIFAPRLAVIFQKVARSIDAIRYSKVLSLPLAKFT